MSTPKRFPAKKGQILFSAGQTGYEFVTTLDGSNHGETVLLARKRTVEGPGGEVILKCVGLPERPATDVEKARARLEDEVRLATYLRHPGIARVHGIKRIEGAVYVIVECVDGNSLNTLSNVVPEQITKFSDALFSTLAPGAPPLFTTPTLAPTRTGSRWVLSIAPSTWRGSGSHGAGR